MIQTRTVKFVLAALVVLTSLSAQGADFYVDGNAPSGGSGGPDDPYLTIRSAYDAAEASTGGDTIWIADGSYTDAGENWSGQEEFSLTQPVSVMGGYAGYSGGVGDWTDANRNPRSTVLDLAGADTRAFSQTSDPAPHQTFTFDGLRFRNASHSGNGGAMLFTEGGRWDKTLQINDCLFEDNSAGQGGALYSTFKEGFSITNSDFLGNTATTGNGGALWFHAERSDLVQNSTFTDNSADSGTGGGVYLQDSANTPITDSTFLGNSAGSGGAVAGFGTASDSNACTLERVILRGNSASTGAAVYKDWWRSL
jgi:parallel beta-helix repeat protein/predicted outer membrane repeat protein